MAEGFNFQINNRLIYGVGRSRELGAFVQAGGFKQLLVFVDEGVLKHSTYSPEIRSILEGAAKTTVEPLRGNEEPDYAYLDQVAATARLQQQPDLIIGIGGGSCLDVTKAVAVLLTNPGSGIDYRGFDKVHVPGIPTVLIPTTAGTGSEVTINAVFTDKSEMRKLGINGRYMNATWALLDAEWTASCPKAAALSAGVDALTHTLESFTCRQHNSLTRVFSREACRLLFENLPCIVEEPGNVERRQRLLMAAYLAGAALFNSGSGIAGALSYPLGVHFKIPHGICGGVFLTSLADYNVENGYTDYAELLDVIAPGVSMSRLEKSKRFASMLRQLCERLGVPKYLDDWGVTAKNADYVASLFLPLQGAFEQNPIAFSAERDAPTMLRRHLMPG
jgi:alcohol dehydrogenase class IV